MSVKAFKSPEFIWSVLVGIIAASGFFFTLRTTVEAQEKRLATVEADVKELRREQIETNREIIQRLARIEAKQERP